MSKIRIDEYLVSQKYLKSKDEVMRYIMAGKIFVNQQKISSGALKYKVEDIKEVIVKNNDKKYSSRGGYKLQKAIDYWELDFKDKDVLDVGSSTGGFTSCSLLAGAKSVYALDVGTNQLDYKLRVNTNVKVFEKTNFRTIKKDFFDIKFDFITMDVSFISVKLLFENVKNFLKEEGIFICLIKPQFEAAKDVKRDKNGVINDVDVHLEVIKDIKLNASLQGLEVIDITDSPISGQKGNKEYLAKIKHKEKND